MPIWTVNIQFKNALTSTIQSNQKQEGRGITPGPFAFSSTFHAASIAVSRSNIDPFDQIERFFAKSFKQRSHSFNLLARWFVYRDSDRIHDPERMFNPAGDRACGSGEEQADRRSPPSKARRPLSRWQAQKLSSK
jgi:hypothetical protein